jgi:hypothetical protein
MDRDAFDSTIRTFKHRTPFRPFTVAMVSGERLEVDHPDALAVRDGVGMFVGPGGHTGGLRPRGRQFSDRGFGRAVVRLVKRGETLERPHSQVANVWSENTSNQPLQLRSASGAETSPPGDLRVLSYMDQERKPTVPVRICPACKGTGLDKSLHHRYTSGGRDDRRCKRCNGECYIEDRESRMPPKS